MLPFVYQDSVLIQTQGRIPVEADQNHVEDNAELEGFFKIRFMKQRQGKFMDIRILNPL